MSCALEKIIMAEVSGHIQSRISYECGSSACGNITAFARMLLSNRQIVSNKMRSTFICTRSMATKHGKVVTYCEGCPPT